MRLHPKTKLPLPEVLSPVGAPDCLPAAVAGGADAVFLGLRHFNARGRAENFRKADLPTYVRYLHDHQVKCYVVMNTLVHDDELPKALDLAAAAVDAKVDAAIIQDLGLWRVLTDHVPTLKRHASTQMTIHDPSQVAVLAALGAERVILARELNLHEVAACTAEAHRLGVETEHFVHGALCYAFSGQCLMSNFAGCRSANRGTCAQNCRFDYQRTNANGVEETGSEISMRDLSLATRVADLARIGVASLKIEGRLKGADYVFTTARMYRAAVDAWANGTKLDAAWIADVQRDVFSRANTTAPLDGVYDTRSRLHRYDPGQDRTADATVIELDRQRSEATLRAKEVRAGQGYTFTVGDFNGGFLITAADRRPDGTFRCKIRISDRGPRISSGTVLFRNADHARKIEAATAMATVPLPIPTVTVGVTLHVIATVGAPLQVHAQANDGRSATVTTSEPLASATGKPLDDAQLRDKLAAFGGTAWHVATLTSQIEGTPFCPASVLKDLRRDIVAQLDAQPAPEPVAAISWTPPESDAPRRRTTTLWVAVSSIRSAQVALDAGADAVWLDDPTFDAWSHRPPAQLPGFDGRLWWRHPATSPLSPYLANLQVPIIAGHVGVLHAAHSAQIPVIADVFCNVFSTSTLLALRALGAQAAVVSLELSSREIARLAARCATLDTPQLAIIAAGRLPSMLTRQEHGLAIGATSAIAAVPRDGGLPYTLQRRHHDTVVWEGRQLSCPDNVAQTAGLVDAWVLEYGGLPDAELASAITRYRHLKDGSADPETVAAADLASAPHGVFSGHLHQGSRELDLVVGKL